jgi:hypothetical protein
MTRSNARRKAVRARGGDTARWGDGRTQAIGMLPCRGTLGGTRPGRRARKRTSGRFHCGAGLRIRLTQRQLTRTYRTTLKLNEPKSISPAGAQLRFGSLLMPSQVNALSTINRFTVCVPTDSG